MTPHLTTPSAEKATRYVDIPEDARRTLFELDAMFSRLKSGASGSFTTPIGKARAVSLVPGMVALLWRYRRELNGKPSKRRA